MINMIENQLIHSLELEYSKKRSKSEKKYEEACKYLPGGDTRTNTYFSPFPHFIERGEGAYIYDADGNKLLDMQNNFTSLIHGHSHRPTVKAICEQATLGSAFSAPIEKQIELAKILTERFPCIDLVRFANSGTEANINALRVARAFTGKQKVVKAEGAYHGTSDIFEVGKGASLNAVKDLLTVQFNDIDNSVKVIEENNQDIACVIIEPVMASAGQIVANKKYLEAIREITKKYKILLIFDEIVTSRLSYGGAQEIYGVEPDITTLGKIIGGGIPIGAFGGRADIMDMYIPKNNKMIHSGTFNGNAISMAAGVATMADYGHDKVDYINKLGDKFKDDFLNLTERLGLKLQLNGIGSLYSIIFSGGPSNSNQSFTKLNGILNMIFFKELINRGVYISPKGMLSISTAMDLSDINFALSNMEETLIERLPVIKDISPELLIK